MEGTAMPTPAIETGAKGVNPLPPWSYSTTPGFVILIAAILIQTTLVVIPHLRHPQGSDHGSPPAEFSLAGLTCLMSTIAFVGLLRGSVGTGVISSEGIRFTPLLRGARMIRWAEVDAVRWTGREMVVRGRGVRIAVEWKTVLRSHARPWVLATLQPYFGLIDVPRAPEPVSVRRIMVAASLAAAPTLVGWWQMLRDPDGNRAWAICFMLPFLLIPVIIAVWLYRRRHWNDVWHLRRQDVSEDQTDLSEPVTRATMNG
jgi:hypothetical protein